MPDAMRPWEGSGLLPVSGARRPAQGQGAAAPNRLMASWRRSQEYGVSSDEIDPVFKGTFDDESLFVVCGHEILTDLQRTLANESISMMLTDADGLVLNRFSNEKSLLRELDRVHCAPGFSYSEREAGTNGLGLALADRVPSVVRADQHYSASLSSYTCAAAPVTDPLTGRLEGTVNLTTWSDQSSRLLLALAQSAASNTAALMLARSTGHRPRPASRGEVFRVQTTRLEPGSGSLALESSGWTQALGEARAALEQGRVVLVTGEAGTGRATIVSQAQRAVRPRDRILSATPPAPEDVDVWMSLWGPELGKAHTAIILCNVDQLSHSAAEKLRALVDDARRRQTTSAEADDFPAVLLSMTAERFDDIPAPLAALIDTVTAVAPLRERPEDVPPLVHHAARKARGRDVAVTSAALRALDAYGWPGNTGQLVDVVAEAATRTDVIDVRHLPPDILADTTHRLTRIETFERDEIIRVLSKDKQTMQRAADELGMSRATIYRKISQYAIRIPHR